MRALPLAALLGLAAPAVAQGSGTLLVGNKGEDTLSLVDLASGRERRRVPAGPAPHEVALSPDGRTAAVVAYAGEAIDLFDVQTGRRLRSIRLGEGARPHGLVWLSDGRIVATAEGRSALMIVDSVGDAPPVAIPTGATGSHMVAVAPDRRLAYVANMGAGTVSVIDLATRAKLRDLPAGSQPEGLAVSPDGRRLWVADRARDALRVFDLASSRLLATLRTGKTPIRVAIGPDGRHAVTSNYGEGTLSVFDAAALRPVRTIRVGDDKSQQVTILFSRDGRRLYVAETGIDRVAEVDFAAGRVLRRLAAGDGGDGLAISPVVAD